MPHVKPGYNIGDEPIPGYRLAEFLGRGGFGEVWKATAPGGTEAALKIIRLGGKEGRKEFRSLQLVKRIKHINLVPINAFWLKDKDGELLDNIYAEQKGLAISDTTVDPTKDTAVPGGLGAPEPAELIIAMGLCDKSLSDRLEECHVEGRGGIQDEELFGYMENAAKAIDFLNSPRHDLDSGPNAAIHHCDIKPQNLMIVGGDTQVCDFGLARLMGTDRTTTVAASLAYAAPECLKGVSSDGSDQYSLAISYYELKTGKLPYQSDTVVDVIEAKRQGTLDFSALPEAEQEVLRRATLPDPAERYPSAMEMVGAIKRAVWPDVKPTQPEPQKRPAYRRLVIGLTVTVAVVAFAAWVYQIIPRNGPENGLVPVPLPAPQDPEQFKKEFMRRVDDGLFADALEMLKKAPDGIGDSEIETLRKDAQGKWLAAAKSAWENKEPKGTLAECDRFLGYVPGDREARLLRARALVGLGPGRYEEALNDLNDLGATENLPKDLRLLQSAITLIAEHFLSKPDPADLTDQFLEFNGYDLDEEKEPRGPPRFWNLNEEERQRVEAVRLDVVVGLLDGRKMDAHFKTLQFEAARETWRLAENVSAGRIELEIKMWRAIIDLRDPEVKTAAVKLALEDAEGVMFDPDISPQQKKALALALGQVAQKKHSDPANDLDLAITLVRKTYDDLLEREILIQLGGLWKARIAIRVKEQKKPTKQEYGELWKDWKRAAKEGCSSGLVDTWLAECLMELKLKPDEAGGAPPPHTLVPPDGDEYVHYVRARVLRALPEFSWDDIVDELAKVFPDPAKDPPQVLTVQNRSAKAVGLVIEAAEKRRDQTKRSFARSELDHVLGNPFPEQGDEAERYYTLLKKVYTFGQTASDDQGKKLKINLALAAWWYEAGRNVELARSLTADLVKLPDTAELAKLIKDLKENLGSDAIPILNVVLRTCLELRKTAPLTPDDRRTAIRACTGLLKLLEDHEKNTVPLADKYAAPFYKLTIGQVVEMAAETEPPAEPAAKLKLAEFYATAGDFIRRHKSAKWAFDVHQELEALFTRAINLDGTQAEYYLRRGHARVEQAKPKLTDALDDVEEALKLKPKWRDAYGLQSLAYLVRARGRTTRKERVDDLKESIIAGEKAIAERSDTDESLPDCLLNLSSAYVERANFERDPDYQKQQQDLNKAVKYADRAAKLEQRFPDYPYLALGNAFEDLAWRVEYEPEDNYIKAINAFGNAYEKNPTSAQALCSRGRCYYKYVVITNLDPRWPGMEMQSRNEVINKCKKDLQSAVNLDRNLVEAHYYLGLANQYQGQYKEADDSFETAMSLANAQDLPYRAVYVVSWARFPLSNGDLQPEQQNAEALRRGQQLLSDLPMPPGASTNPVNENAWIRGQVHMRKGEFAEALRVYNDALPSDLTTTEWSDVSLLLERSLCRLSLSKAQWNWTAAKAAIQDAERAAYLAIPRASRAVAHSYASGARFRAYRELTFTADARMTAEENLDQAIDDILKAIRLGRYSDSESIVGWATSCTALLAFRVSKTGEYAERGKDGKEALACLEHAINRIQQETELAPDREGREKWKKKRIGLERYKGEAVKWLQDAVDNINRQIQLAVEPEKREKLKKKLIEIEDYKPTLQR